MYFLVHFLVDLQQTSPLPVCPGDNVILTCTATVFANMSDNLVLYLYDTCDQDNREFYASQAVNNSNSSTLGRFTAKVVAVSDSSIVATATIKGVTSNDAPCTGIKCVDVSGGDKTLYVVLGKKKSMVQIKKFVIHV